MQTEFSVQRANRTGTQFFIILAAVAVVAAAIGLSIGRWVLPEGGGSTNELVSTTRGINTAPLHRELEWQTALGISAPANAIDAAVIHRQIELQFGADAINAVNAGETHRQLEWQTAIDASALTAVDAGAVHREIELEFAVSRQSAADLHRQLEWEAAR